MTQYQPARSRRNVVASVMAAALSSALLVGSSFAAADSYYRTQRFVVEITNITKGPAPGAQVFSPPVLATHRASVSIFSVGEPALDELAVVAESGAGTGLADLLNSLPQVRSAFATEASIPAGQTLSFEVDGRRNDRLSIVSMLVNTNDAFLAVNTVKLPRYRNQVLTYYATAYDAGSEGNNEDCDFIPGPACTGGNERDTAGAEGFVHVHNGVHGIGDLEPYNNDWRNPVAKVTVRRVR